MSWRFWQIGRAGYTFLQENRIPAGYRVAEPAVRAGL
jgi:hypothetical protein